MKPIGQPFVIQNTEDHGWLVTWTNAISVGPLEGPAVENLSFTVALPRRADLTIEEVQTFAMKRAAELLQELIQGRQKP